MKKDLKRRETIKKGTLFIKNLPNSSNCKIGITSNPSKRFQFYNIESDYEQMEVICRSNSLAYIKDLERDLIIKNWFYIENKIGGGGGNLSNPPFYLYVVVKRCRNYNNFVPILLGVLLLRYVLKLYLTKNKIDD